MSWRTQRGTDTKDCLLVWSVPFIRQVRDFIDGFLTVANASKAPAAPPEMRETIVDTLALGFAGATSAAGAGLASGSRTGAAATKAVVFALIFAFGVLFNLCREGSQHVAN